MSGLLYTAMNNYILAPSTIAADLTRLAEQIAAYESAGADWLHVETCPDLVKTGIASLGRTPSSQHLRRTPVQV